MDGRCVPLVGVALSNLALRWPLDAEEQTEEDDFTAVFSNSEGHENTKPHSQALHMCIHLCKYLSYTCTLYRVTNFFLSPLETLLYKYNMCATVELKVKVHSDTVPAARLFTIPLYCSCFFSESFFMLWRRADAFLTFSLFSSSSLFFISSTCFFFSSCWEREGRRREGRVEWRGEKGVGRGKLEGKTGVDRGTERRETNQRAYTSHTHLPLNRSLVG